MANLTLHKSAHFTGSITSPEVTVPQNMDAAYVVANISAPISPSNIFDISVYIDVFENGQWNVRDSNVFHRDAVTGPLEDLFYVVTARLERIAGKRARARIDVGQCTVAVDVSVTAT